MEKTVLIVNGNPGSGKTTVETMITCEVNSIIYSSIDFVKEAYRKYFGWDGYSKSPADRKFLSDMKKFLLAETNIIEEVILEAFDDFMVSKEKVLMIDIREIDEIEKYKKRLDAKTVYVNNPRTKRHTSNTSDAQVGNYEYDYVIENDGDLVKLRHVVQDFVDKLEDDNNMKEHILLFKGRGGGIFPLDNVYNLKDTFEMINKFLKERNYESDYNRMWATETGDLHIDFGSHTEFFIVRNGARLLA